MGMCRPILQILTLFQTKRCQFPHPFSNLEEVTKRNITCLHKTEIMSPLLRLERQQKDFLKSISNSHIRVSFFLSYSLGIETTTTSIHKRSSFVNHTRFGRSEWAKSIPVFKPTRSILPWSDTTYVDKIREYSPPPRPPKHLHTLSAAFPPFILRIRNYRSETTKRTTNVMYKILNQKVLRTCVGLPTKKKSRRSLLVICTKRSFCYKSFRFFFHI